MAENPLNGNILERTIFTGAKVQHFSKSPAPPLLKTLNTVMAAPTKPEMTLKITEK